MGQLRLLEPVIITPSLLPGVHIGDGFVSVQRHARPTSEGRIAFTISVAIPAGDFKFQVTSPRPSLQEALATGLTFLSAAGEGLSYEQRTGRKSDNADMFERQVVEWAAQNSDEISMLAIGIEETPDLIEEVAGGYDPNPSDPVHVGPPVSRGTRKEEHALKEAELQEHMINYLKREGPRGTPLSMYDAELTQRRGKYREAYRTAFGEEPPPDMVPNASASRWSERTPGVFEAEKTVYEPNRVAWESKNGLSAALFVGMNVGDKQVFRMPQVVAATRRLLRDMLQRKENSSYIVQTGVYTHEEPNKPDEVIEERSVQILIFDEYPPTPQEEFVEQMKKLAETLAEEFLQAAVIVDIRRGNVSIGTYGMAP